MMNLDTPAGSEVVLTYPESGWDSDRAQVALLGLEKGMVFRVKRVSVDPFQSSVQFEGIDGEFNTVQFSNVEAV
jgi:hypothetical protein